MQACDQEKIREMKHALHNRNLLIIWKPEYELGVPIIDEQHRAIVAIINSLYCGIRDDHGEEILNPVFDTICAYTRIHFAIEEDHHRKCSFPGMKEHKELHRVLAHELKRAGEKSVWRKDSQAFLQFLKGWWLDHICDKDRVYRNYLLQMGVL
ncbi:MAG: hemerythrin family protein [Planctomycetes bacterium]|nr:hemerythrin family protein [Planctomycetota bacterium]